MGRSTTYTLAYEWDDAPNRLPWKLVTGDIQRVLDGAYEFAEVDGGTDVTYHLRVDLAIPLPGFVKRRAEARIISTALRELRAHVTTARSTRSEMRILLFTGKGGVGKTTTAAATAVALRRRRPAHDRAVDRPGALPRRRVRHGARRPHGRDHRRPVGPAARRAGPDGGGLGRHPGLPAGGVPLGRRRRDRGRGALGRARDSTRSSPSPTSSATPRPASGTPSSSTAPPPPRRSGSSRCPACWPGGWSACSRWGGGSTRSSARCSGRSPTCPMPGDDVFGAVERFYERLDGVKELLTDRVRHHRPAGREPRAGGRRRGPPDVHLPVAVRLQRRRGHRQPPAARRRLRPVVRGLEAAPPRPPGHHRGGVRPGAGAARRADPARARGHRPPARVRRRALRRGRPGPPPRRRVARSTSSAPTTATSSPSTCRSPRRTSSRSAGGRTSCSCGSAPTAGRSCCPTRCAAGGWSTPPSATARSGSPSHRPAESRAGRRGDQGGARRRRSRQTELGRT